jgi:hypothetical protein
MCMKKTGVMPCTNSLLAMYTCISSLEMNQCVCIYDW